MRYLQRSLFAEVATLLMISQLKSLLMNNNKLKGCYKQCVFLANLACGVFMMDLLKSLGKRIQAVRTNKDITQEELAHRTGLNAKYISSIERGQKNATVNTLDKIAKGLEVELYELFLLSDELAPEKIARTAIDTLLKQADRKTLNLCLDFLKKASSS